MKKRLKCLVAICLGLLSLACLMGMPRTEIKADSNYHTVTFNYNSNSVLTYLPDNDTIKDSLKSYAIIVANGGYAVESRTPSSLINPYYTYEWTIDGQVVVDISNYVITDDTMFIALWTPKNYKVEYNYSGFENEITNLESGFTYNVESSRIYLYRPNRLHYVFKGWFSSLNNSSAIQQLYIEPRSTGDKTYYAKFSPIQYYINYNTDATHENVLSYNVEDDNISLLAPSKYGHIFKGWYLDKTFKTPVSEIDCSNGGNLELYAKWELEVYEVTYILPSGVTKVVEVEYGKKASLPNLDKSIFEIVKTSVSRNNITQDTTIELEYVNIWYVYVLVLGLIAGTITLIIVLKKKRENTHNTLRQVYRSNASNKRKY